MFYYNARYKFGLPASSPQAIPGTIIAASAIRAGQLIRRDFRKYPHLQHRLFDPQMYLAGLDKYAAEESVLKLASWPWFGARSVPQYDSDKHGSLKNWKDLHKLDLLTSWSGQAPTAQDHLEASVRDAIAYQLDLGCDALILPAPLTTVAAGDFGTEVAWMDAGLALCRELKTALPVFATVAISDNVLKGVDPRNHPLLHTITNQIAARDQLAGAYLIVEQSTEEGYVCKSRESVLALLLMIDDLVRGAAKQAIVNYAGSLGAIATGAGATIWATGYYLSQRRLRLTDFDDKIARAYPRYYSLRLAGDVGLEHDLLTAFRGGAGDHVLLNTQASSILKAALLAGRSPSDVLEWRYSMSNLDAAMGHYNETMYKIGSELSALDRNRRIEMVQRWLERAATLAEELRGIGLVNSHYTELAHQRIWLKAYQDWRAHAGV
jgi:hypothetical protein